MYNAKHINKEDITGNKARRDMHFKKYTLLLKLLLYRYMWTSAAEEKTPVCSVTSVGRLTCTTVLVIC